MISEVVMPQMGADMTEGTIVRWLKHEGDEVTRGEIIAEIETDKANVEIEAFGSGTFRKVLASEGDVVQVGEIIAVIAAPDDDISRYANGATTTSAAPPPLSAPAKSPEEAPPTPEPPPPTPAQAASDAPAPLSASGPATGRVRASPLARRVAEQRGVDLATVRGTGPDGRIIKRDVEAAQPSAVPAASTRPIPAAMAEDQQVPMSRMRQAIARNMVTSKREAPHYYLLVDIDMTAAIDLRAQVNAAIDESQRVSVNDLVVRACALTLQQHPEFNATIDGERVTRRAAQNICIAIALDDGLIAPAIVDAGSMTLLQIAVASRDLVDRAKSGRLRAEELTSGTFTITNLGAFGIETLIGIIQPPQTAILGVGSVMEQPVARHGSVVVRQLMKVALSADHRVTDGAQGARFLVALKLMLEQPARLLL